MKLNLNQDPKKLIEMFRNLPGSFADYQQRIDMAIRNNPPAEFGTTQYPWDLWLEGCLGDFPAQVIVSNSNTGRAGFENYYRANVSENESGDIMFSNIEEVDIDLAITAKNEMRVLQESTKEVKHKDLNETSESKITVNEARKGSVQIAQIADKKNLNDRIYPKGVLKEAVDSAAKHIKENGPLFMDSHHRETPNNATPLREMVALINDITFNEDTGVVALPEITFLENQAGKDILALLKEGASLQVSQRGYGTSHVETNEDTGEVTEYIDFLRIQGFDYVPPGDAAVPEADFTLENQSEGNPPDNEKEESKIVEESLKELIEEIGSLKKTIKTSLAESAKPDAAETAKPDDSKTAKPDAAISDLTSKLETLLKKVEKLQETSAPSQTAESFQNTKAWKQMQLDLKKSTTALAEVKKKRDLEQLEETAQTAIDSILSDYKRFSDSQKAVIASTIDPTIFVENIEDVSDTEEVTKLLKPGIIRQVTQFDKMIAASHLKNIDYPLEITDGLANSSEGITHTKIINENVPGAEDRRKLFDATMDCIKQRMPADYWFMPEDHQAMKPLGKIMDNFYRDNYAKLVEANEEVTQSDIGGRIATIDATVIPIAWRMITAFEVVDVGMMMNRLEDIKITTHNPEHKKGRDDIAKRYGDMEIGENAEPARVGPTYGNFSMYATIQSLKSYITPHAIATAKNTPMEPMADMLACLSMDIRDRTDEMLWWQHIIAALSRETTEVNSFETLTRIDADPMEWVSANRGWLPFEWVKSADTNDNPESAKFVRTYPDDGSTAPSTSLSQQGIEVQTSAGTAVALIYNTDYTVNAPDGSVTLTSSGETKRAGNDIEAKYTYSNVMVPWSIVPPAGTRLYDNLLNLRRAVGIAKISVEEENWMPNFMGNNIDTEDLMSHGPQFTNDGGNPSDILDEMNNISKYAGLKPYKSTAISKDYVIVGMQGSAYHRVHTAWHLKHSISETLQDHYAAIQFSASDVPVRDKIGVVGILNRQRQATL